MREMDMGTFLAGLRSQISQLRVDLTTMTARVEALEARPVPPESNGRTPGCTCAVISGPHAPRCAVFAYAALPVLTQEPQPRCVPPETTRAAASRKLGELLGPTPEVF